MNSMPWLHRWVVWFHVIFERAGRFLKQPEQTHGMNNMPWLPRWFHVIFERAGRFLKQPEQTHGMNSMPWLPQKEFPHS